MNTKIYLIKAISKKGNSYYELCVSDTEHKTRVYKLLTHHEYDVLSTLYKTYEKGDNK